MSGDSHVCGVAHTKGRSFFPGLNGALKQTLHTQSGNDVCVSELWVGSSITGNDDSIKNVPLRAPSIPVPEWLTAFRQHDYGLLDKIVGANPAKIDDGRPDLCLASEHFPQNCF